jgi:protein-disulfide isomerase
MKNFAIAVGAVALLGAGAIVMVSNSGKAPVVTLDPTIKPSIASGYVMGSHDARIEIAEFGDFECHGCGVWFDMTEPDVRERLVQTGLVRFRFYDFPLPIPSHANALSAHVAAGCSDEQGKFWEMHDRLYRGQAEWNMAATANPKKVFEGYAKAIGLDAGEWGKCYDERRPLPHFMANIAEGQRLGVGGTPTFLIGNKMVNEVLSFEKMKQLVDSALADTASRTQPPGRGGRGGK